MLIGSVRGRRDRPFFFSYNLILAALLGVESVKTIEISRNPQAEAKRIMQSNDYWVGFVGVVLLVLLVVFLFCLMRTTRRLYDAFNEQLDQLRRMPPNSKVYIPLSEEFKREVRMGLFWLALLSMVLGIIAYLQYLSHVPRVR